MLRSDELEAVACIIRNIRQLESELDAVAIGGRIFIWDAEGEKRLGSVEENYVDGYREWTFVADGAREE